MKKLAGILVILLAACTTVPNYRPLAKHVMPSVVELYGEQKNSLSDQIEERTYCTGVAISPTHILTAGHCIALPPEEMRKDGKVLIKTKDGKKYVAKIAASAFEDTEEAGKGRDAAVLVIESGTLVPATMALAYQVEVGEVIAIVGNSFGKLTYSFTTGTVSALDRPIGGESLIQATVEARGGNSGGPAFNMNGDLIGIVTRADGQGITFIVPIATAIKYITEVMNGKVKS